MRQEPKFPLTLEEDLAVMFAALERDKKNPPSKEEELKLLVAAGIFDENANPTEPYKELFEWIKREAA